MERLSLILEQDPAKAAHLKALLHHELIKNLSPRSPFEEPKKEKEIEMEKEEKQEGVIISLLEESENVEKVSTCSCTCPPPGNPLVEPVEAKVDSEKDTWYRVPVAGDGGCMFTSARLGWELIAVLQSIEKEEEINNFILDGNNEVAIRGGFLVRQRICEWYKSGLAKSVPSMGKYTEKDGGRDWCRGDLLAMEMVQRENEVPEEGVERTKAQIKYLLHMMLPKTWGGTPEYFAFAQIFKLKIVIYVPGFPDRSKLVMRDCIEPGNVSCPIPINLLFLPNQRHYELLLSRQQYDIIVSKVGASRVENIRKIA